MATDEMTPDPQEAARAQRLLGEYARSTDGEHDGEPLHAVACDLIAELFALATGNPDGELPESYGTSTTERVASLAARSVWNTLETNARRAAQASGAPEPDGPSFEEIETAIAATDAYLRST
jgi:hypothetical protein